MTDTNVLLPVDPKSTQGLSTSNLMRKRLQFARPDCVIASLTIPGYAESTHQGGTPHAFASARALHLPRVALTV
jgi:hypothetical protein